MEKGMAIHSSILAWRVPWTEEPGRLQSRGRKESDTTEHTDTLMHLNKELSKSRDKCLSNQIWVKFPQSTLITEVAFSESYHLMKGQARKRPRLSQAQEWKLKEKIWHCPARTFREDMDKGEELNSDVNVILTIRIPEPSFKLQVRSALRRTNARKLRWCWIPAVEILPER